MSTEKKLTAMQEFIDRLKNEFGFLVSNNVTEMYLEKEKQHIIDAGKECFNCGWDISKGNKPKFKSVEHYYNETYKK